MINFSESHSEIIFRASLLLYCVTDRKCQQMYFIILGEMTDEAGKFICIQSEFIHITLAATERVFEDYFTYLFQKFYPTRQTAYDIHASSTNLLKAVTQY